MVDNSGARADLTAYVDLIDTFVDRKLTGPQFESAYLHLVKNDRVLHGEPAFPIIDRLFSDVDEYFDDPDLPQRERDQETENLRQCAAQAAEKLRAVGD